MFGKQFTTKNHNSFPSGLSDFPSSKTTWISNFFRLRKIYIYTEQLIKLTISVSIIEFPFTALVMLSKSVTPTNPPKNAPHTL